jgi:hypothetical protein
MAVVAVPAAPIPLLSPSLSPPPLRPMRSFIVLAFYCIVGVVCAPLKIAAYL